jgi:hypothetical protein
MRDYQKQKFYAFERAMIKRFLPSNLEDGLSFEESIALGDRICKTYKIKTPMFKKGRSTKIAYYRRLQHTITLPPWAQRDNVVLHEVAHAVTFAKDYDDPGHGQYFVSIWMQMFSRMYDVSLEELRACATQHKIDFC